VTIVDFGVDARADLTSVQRTITFESDGPTMISVRLTGVNAGKVRLCLRGQGTAPQCITAHSGELTRAVFDAGQVNWTVTAIGTAAGQHATVVLDFNALALDIGLDSFRFNGLNDQYNNGFQVVFGALTDGTLRVNGQIDDGNDTPYPWELNVSEDDVTVFDQPGGPSTTVDVSTTLSGGPAYAVTLYETEAATTGAFPVFLSNFHLTYP
jgi:hypothetical protein